MIVSLARWNVIFIYIFNHLAFKLVLKPCFLFLMRLYMSQIYLKLPISYYLWKLVLNDNLKTFFYLEFLSELLIDKIQY